MSPLERLTLLAESAHTLSGELDLAQALRGVGRLLTRALADWCTLDLLVAHDRVERAVVVHRARQLTPAPYEGELPPMSQDAQGPLARALRGAGPLLFTGRPAAGPAPGGLDARYAELFGQLGAGSTVVAPLLARRQVLGALTLGRTGRARPFTRQDLSLVQDLTQGLALKVQNSRLFDRTRNIAERLQRSLLPNLPDIENLQITARYAPSSVTAEVGGDWYDGFLLPNGDTALVIGDVAGHDIEATAAMSQLRNMVRGIAVVCQEDPQEVLRHLDVASQSLTQDATATCIYAVVKGAAAGPWELVHSSAGHLPPLLIMPDGRTRFLRDAAGVLLGTGLDLRRPVSRDVLPAHATVLLYTDGLIERRDEPLDQSLGRLGDLTATLAREPLDVICDELLIRLGADNTDDIAVVALRPEPPP
jgi:serine phosphatase RsbU (regulator of sigma subunit)